MNRRCAVKVLAIGAAGARLARPASTATLDVVVTDEAGNPVRDLSPGDFAVLEGGQPRKLTAFAAVDNASGASRAAPPLPLPGKIDPAEVHRNVVLVVDDAGISEDAANSLHQALSKFVNENMGERDAAVLFRSSGGTSALERLTAEKSVLRQAIERIVWNPAAAPPKDPPWPEVMRYALEAVRRVRGRKAVVLFWQKEPAQYPYDRLTSLANRAWAGIYAVRAAGMGETPPAIASMAAQTSGLALREDDWSGLQDVLKDQESYYLLGFDSPASQDDEAPSVKVTRPGLVARSRRSLPGIVPPESYNISTSPLDELHTLMSLDPLDASELPVRISTLFQYSGSNWLVVTVMVDGHHVAMTQRLSGIYEGALEIVLRVLDENGRVVADQNASQSLNLKEADYRQMLAEGLNYAIRLQVPRPGVLQAFAGIRDGTSGRTGIARQLAEVPDISNGVLVLSGIVVEPAAAELKPGQNASGAARTAFRAGEQMAYGCTIYNVSVDAQNRAELVMTSRMYRGSKMVFQGKPVVLTTKEAVASKTLTLRGTVSLGPDTAPGDLIFQLIVEDRHAAGDRRTASEWIEFRVR